MLLLLLACDNPISNAVFMADRDFLDALPGPDRMGFPANLRGLTAGDEPLLAYAGQAANDLLPVTASMITIGDIFRSTEPIERTPTSRRYAARPITLEGSETTWWMRADLTRAADAAPIQWVIEGAIEEDGPWRAVAEGRHGADGVGSFTWFTPVVAELSSTGGNHPLADVEYLDSNRDGLREVSFTFPAPFVLPATFGFVGDVGFAFTGAFDFAAAGNDAPVALYAIVFALPDHSGFSEGFIFQDEAEMAFKTCWDEGGNRTYAGGPPVVEPTGDESLCAAL